MEKPNNGIVVAAYCVLETAACGYRGVDLETGSVLFQRNYKKGERNLVEFLGLVHGAMFLKKHSLEQGFSIPKILYSESDYAIGSFERRSLVTSLLADEDSLQIFNELEHCKRWLCDNIKMLEKYSLRKWFFLEWNENPAKF